MPTTVVRDRIPEWKLQAAAAAELDAIGQSYAASMEGVRLNPYQAQVAKATGMKAGEPDLRLYYPGPHIVFVELKGAGGRLTDGQRERIPLLRGLGFIVHIVFAASEDAMRASVGQIATIEAAVPGSSAGLASASWWPKAK